MGRLAAQDPEPLLFLISLDGFRPDYLEIREAASLRPASPEDRRLVVLGAAYLGNTRLIDNLSVELAGD